MTDDDCFYCDQPIGDEERVKGDKADAHRRCVRAELEDRLGPHWESRFCDVRAAVSGAQRAARTRAERRDSEASKC